MKSFLKALGEEEEHANQENDESCDNLSASSLLERLRLIVKKLRSSPDQRKRFLGQCRLADVDELMLSLDVPTRWNSTFAMIQRAIKVREGLRNWLGTDPEIGKVKLGFLQFSDTDWTTLDLMCGILQKFEEASIMMSGEKYPTLSLSMLVFIELFTFIESKVHNDNDSYGMNAALSAAHGVLAKYYSSTDDSCYYILSVLLDPRFKATYLESKVSTMITQDLFKPPFHS